jgi:RNA polymerase sigma factor (sigma-70 family)
MTSEEIYLNIAQNDAQESYKFLKTNLLRFIQNRMTINKCRFEAEDRFCTAFSKLYEKIVFGHLKNTSNIVAYFLVICKNDLIQNQRRSRVSYYDNFYDEILNGEQIVINIDEFSSVAKELVNTLPSQLKSVCGKVYLEDKNHFEIAKELNINYENVRKYSNKGLALMRKKINPEYRNLLFAA